MTIPTPLPVVAPPAGGRLCRDRITAACGRTRTVEGTRPESGAATPLLPREVPRFGRPEAVPRVPAGIPIVPASSLLERRVASAAFPRRPSRSSGCHCRSGRRGVTTRFFGYVELEAIPRVDCSSLRRRVHPIRAGGMRYDRWSTWTQREDTPGTDTGGLMNGCRMAPAAARRPLVRHWRPQRLTGTHAPSSAGVLRRRRSP